MAHHLKELERVFKGLANRRRLAIVRMLSRERELPVAEIARRLRLSFTSTSKHLGILRGADIVDRRQESLTVFYSISGTISDVARSVLVTISNSRE